MSFVGGKRGDSWLYPNSELCFEAFLSFFQKKSSAACADTKRVLEAAAYMDGRSKAKPIWQFCLLLPLPFLATPSAPCLLHVLNFSPSSHQFVLQCRPLRMSLSPSRSIPCTTSHPTTTSKHTYIHTCIYTTLCHTPLNFEHFAFLLKEWLHRDAFCVLSVATAPLKEHTYTPCRTQLTFGPSQLMFTYCEDCGSPITSSTLL